MTGDIRDPAVLPASSPCLAKFASIFDFEPVFLDGAGHSFDSQWPMVPGIFSGYVLKLAIIFMLYPGIEIMLVGEAVPEMVEWVKAWFAENGHAEVD
ncbi:MAG: hypothetical protein GWP02_07100, partial [Desulfobulbaceae bacterium]|nr:hypothetical protein [Desulfobulbaceae bacterium]